MLVCWCCAWLGGAGAGEEEEKHLTRRPPQQFLQALYNPMAELLLALTVANFSFIKA